ncbi:protein polyglycylase TTLL10 isoform X2 [Channa argus]|uniref:protein polyglycylase TTLL10 isoform X2 n=1 Tax=Channa argus TaxID=215402 RepID=UPI003520B193
MQEDAGGGELPASPDHSGVSGVTSDDVPETKSISHMTVSKEKRDGGSGAGLMKQYLWKSFPRSLPICSYRDREQQAEEPRGAGPFYFIGGANGAEIVSCYCESKGWRRIYNKNREDFKLKWCENKSASNYYNFREGEQLLYQIPNNKVLTTKIGLLSSLREYERVCSKINHGQGFRRLKMEEFIPTTFRMDIREEREAFFAQQKDMCNSESHMWICKPTGLNQGRGIFLLKNQDDVAAFRLKLHHIEDSQANKKMHHLQPQAHIVQHYIQNPLLLKGKKFDVRSYLLIACTAPYMVFFRHGYVRLTCDLYDPSSNNLSAHLTNQYMQKKNPLYNELKEDTVWSMERFNAHINDGFQVAKGLPRDWVLGTFAKRMQRIMIQCFLAVKSKLRSRLGFFDLIGCDFLIDEEFKVWLLELNCNPALHTNCKVLKEVIPSTVVETLDLTLEIFNKCRLRQNILPLASQREFVLIYNGVFSPISTLAKSNTLSEFQQKTTQKTESRWHKSGKEEKCVPFASSNNSENVSVSPEGSGSSVSGQHGSCATVTSPLHQNSSSVQGGSHLRGSNNSKQTVNKVKTQRSEKPKPRAELKMNKCILRYHVKVADDPKSQQMNMILPLSSPALTKGTSTGGAPETTQFPQHPRCSVCVDKCERGEEIQ